MYKAYLEGRGKVDPSKEWYEGELGFFDHYIIPLARELADCGVFGVCSDEYLNYAEQNRKEWALTGKGIIAGIVESLRHMQRETDLMPPSKRRGSMSSVGRPSRRRASMSSAVPLQSPNTPQLAEDRLKLLKQKLSNSSSSIVEMSSSAELPRVMSVLVVDDDKILRKMFARSVKKIAPGWSIQEAGSGEEALECVANADTDFDLILMDMYMGTDESKLIGPEAVAELRKKGVRSKICGMSANDVEQMFDESGANAFVFKPLRFRTEPLKSELERIWGSKDEWDNTFLTLPSPQASPPEDDSDYESP
jgi:CheY-like chemotaxis protein